MSVSLAYKEFDAAAVAKFAPSPNSNDSRVFRNVPITSENQDRDGDVVRVDGIKLDNFLRNPVLLFVHNKLPGMPVFPVGKVLSFKKGALADGTKALFADIQFANIGNEFIDTLYKLWQEGYMSATSIGFKPIKARSIDQRGRPLTDLVPAGNVTMDADIASKFQAMMGGPREYLESELVELSVVPVGSNTDAVYQRFFTPTVMKSFEALVHKTMDTQNGLVEAGNVAEKKCVGTHCPDCATKDAHGSAHCEKCTAPDVIKEVTCGGAHCEGCVNKSHETTHCEMCATKEVTKGGAGSGNFGHSGSDSWDAASEVKSASTDDLNKMCAWVADKPDADLTKSDYKLPHHERAGYKTSWPGVKAAMGALLGARGGVDIPQADKDAVYNHLAKHYAEFDKKPPENKDYTPAQLKRLFSNSSPSEVARVLKSLTVEECPNCKTIATASVECGGFVPHTSEAGELCNGPDEFGARGVPVKTLVRSLAHSHFKDFAGEREKLLLTGAASLTYKESATQLIARAAQFVNSLAHKMEIEPTPMADNDGDEDKGNFTDEDYATLTESIETLNQVLDALRVVQTRASQTRVTQPSGGDNQAMNQLNAETPNKSLSSSEIAKSVASNPALLSAVTTLTERLTTVANEATSGRRA